MLVTIDRFKVYCPFKKAQNFPCILFRSLLFASSAFNSAFNSSAFNLSLIPVTKEKYLRRKISFLLNLFSCYLSF